jgi:hypothetical protein
MLALAAIGAGCGGDLAPLLCDGGSCGTQSSWRKNYQMAINRKVDLLFVVDDTAAIAPHRDAVAAGFAAMAPRLRDPTAPTSLHVGFIRTGSCDASTRGGACGVDTGEQFLRSEWCHMVDNISGAYEEIFACLGDLGAADCAPAQPLEAARRFLTGAAQRGWEGFLRPEAYLMIVVISAQDDASGQPAGLTPALAIANDIKAVKLDPSQIVVSIIGPGGDCAAGEPPGPRLLEFVNQFGANGLYLPLCSGQLSLALDRITQQINSSILPPCATNVRDTDPEMPGLQANCTVEEFANNPDGTRTSSTLPNCDTSAPPCWRLIASGGNCDGYIFQVQRAPDWCIESGAYGTIECLGCADPRDPACQPQR